MSLSGRYPLIAMVGCMSLAGCGDAPEPASTTATPANTGQKAAALPSTMVAAVSSGLGAEAIGVHFELKATPTAGAELPVDIVLLPQRKFASVRAHFNTAEGLQLVGGREMEPQTDVAPQAVLRHRLVLQPAHEGIFLVSVGVDTEGDEGNVVRMFSIPIIVKPASAGTAAPTPAG